MLPVVSTSSVSNITRTSLNSGGIVTSDGGAIIIAKGVCWSKNQNPTISDNKSNEGPEKGSFSSSIIDLIPGYNYFVRAYATNSVGTSYGNEINATTLVSLPTITTNGVNEIYFSGATIGYNITDDGGTSVTDHGLCWSTNQNPTLSDSKTINAAGTGSWVSTMARLTPGATYHVRAFATNSDGTAYGNDVTVVLLKNGTEAPVTDVEGNVYKTVRLGTQVWMAENLRVTKFQNGSPIPNIEDSASWANSASAGYCWFLNDSTKYKSSYGPIYNGYCVTDSRNISPNGWHIPSNNEWITLINYVQAADYGCGPIKEAGTLHWLSSNIIATNSTGFTALPIAYRDKIGSFCRDSELGKNCYFWSSTVDDTLGLYMIGIGYENYNIGPLRDIYNSRFGMAIRCIKD